MWSYIKYGYYFHYIDVVIYCCSDNYDLESNNFNIYKSFTKFPVIEGVYYVEADTVVKWFSEVWNCASNLYFRQNEWMIK